MKKIVNKINAQSYIDPEMLEAAFNFWFNDDRHIRSPFPIYIRERLTEISTEAILDWANQISEDGKKEINDEIISEKFEEIIFETALKLVLTEDEKITIRYPFLLRIDDKIEAKNENEQVEESIVVDRLIIKKGDHTFLKVVLRNLSSNLKWEAKFELPE